MWLQKFKMRSWLVVSAIGVAFVLQSCSKNDEDVYNAYAVLEEDIVKIQSYLDANNIDAKMDSATGVFFKIHTQGEGYKALGGIAVDVHYQGLTIDGDEFTNSFDGNAHTITIGSSETYPSSITDGLIIGISMVKEGDSATVYVPSPYGYQNRAYQNIPPNTILQYNYKMVDIKNLSEDYAKIDQYIEDHSLDATIEPEFGVRYAIHRTGNNVSPKTGARISTHYQGELLDGTVFDSSYDSGVPLDFTYGNGDLIVGFEMGISQLHENDSATIFIPSIYGYKDVAKGDIPANSVLVFGLDIVRISNIF